MLCAVKFMRSRNEPLRPWQGYKQKVRYILHTACAMVPCPQQGTCTSPCLLRTDRVVSEFPLISYANKNHVRCIAGAQQIFVKGTNKHVTQECSRREAMSQCGQWPGLWNRPDCSLSSMPVFFPGLVRQVP